MGRRKGENPQQWLSGPDPVDHKLYNDCLRAKAQAMFRGEDWAITPEEYIKMWRHRDLYLSKGRSVSDLCLTRIDLEKGWTMDNVAIVSRHESMKRSGRIGPRRGPHVRIKLRSFA
jgi:hypothetical protein